MSVPSISTPTAAYRADVATSGKPFGVDDDVWLAAATELHLAVALTGAAREQHLFEAIGIALDLLGDEQVEAFADREWAGDRGYADALIVLSERVRQAAAWHLAAVMMDDLAIAAEHLSPVQRGRILALRARVDWKLGRLEEAEERFLAVGALGKTLRSDELSARAAIGLVSLAQLRGNFPAVREHASAAARLVKGTGFRTLAREAQHGMMLGAAKQRDFSEAVLAGWETLRLSEGDAELEAEAFINLGQLMLEAGHPARARASFAAVLDRAAPARLMLPAVSGLALASANLRVEATVEWAVREVSRARTLPVPSYELASAHLECAVALQLLGRRQESGDYRRIAEDIADKQGFHELRYAAAELATRSAGMVTFAPSAERVAVELSELEPERLPNEVRFEAAPA